MVRWGGRVLRSRDRGSALVVLGLATALASAASAATTEPRPLPWNSFGEASAEVVSVEQVTCPKTPDEPVLKARLIHDGEQYIYLAKDRRWLVWRVPSGRPNDETPGYVWFGNHGPADDVLRVVSAMPYDDAQKYFRGPCGWIDPDMI
jgi:hypothetical protein